MKSLAAALVEAQKEMPAVTADAVNPHFNSKFVSLDHLIAKTKPVLTKHGLAIVQMPSNLAGQPALATTIIHAESGESITDTLPLVLDGQNMQKLGGALTYARRYSWAAALGICDEADDDGNTASAPGTGATKDSGATRPDLGSAAGSGAAAAGASTAAPQHPAPGAASVKQQGFIKKLLGDNGFTVEDLAKPLDQFTKADASQTIEQLQAGTFNPASLAALGAGFIDDSDIPFLPTIDGIGN